MTVFEIAELAGVSIGTVDRVLHGREGVAKATREKIERIVRESGYEPNLHASRLALGTRKSLRVVMPRADQDSGYWGLCLSGIERGARSMAERGIAVEVEQVDRYDESAYRLALTKALDSGDDGLLLAPVQPEAVRAALVGASVPYAFFDSEVEGASPRFCVAQDAYRGGVLAGRALSLLARGPSLVALNAHPGDPHLRRRISGCRDFFGVSAKDIPELECPGLEEAAHCAQFMSRLVAERGLPNGILVANASGHRVGEWLSSEGLKRDCALVSWDLVEENERALAEGRIDCVVSQRPVEMGREALELLARATAPGSQTLRSRSMPLELYLKENLGTDMEVGYDERD
jgi:LacI family transcriptional regulator